MLRFIKVLYIILGTFFILIGLIGVVLPVVPTMPFLIIAGLFYIKSSEKLYNHLIKTKFFGPHVKNYVELRQIEHRFKLLAILFLWIPTMITVIFILDNNYIRGVSILFALLVTWHILSLKSIR